jgi:hypothetical protein
MERRMVARETLPAVDAKSLRVPSEGVLRRWGDRFLSPCAGTPWTALSISTAESIGRTRTTRWTWSGWMARSSIVHPWSLPLASMSVRQSRATSPTRTGFRRFGHPMRWETTRWMRCSSRRDSRCREHTDSRHGVQAPRLKKDGWKPEDERPASPPALKRGGLRRVPPVRSQAESVRTGGSSSSARSHSAACLRVPRPARPRYSPSGRRPPQCKRS